MARAPRNINAGFKGYSLSFPRLSKAATDDGLECPSALAGVEASQLTVLCSGPGMGKTFIINKIAHNAKDNDFHVVNSSFDNETADVAAKKLVRLCRDTLSAMSQHPHTLVIVDGVTPGDERQIHSEASALKRLIAGGCQVLLCVRPEAEQLVEAFDGALVISTEELTFRSYSEGNEYFRLSGGIPALVAALRADVALGGDVQEMGVRYRAALEGLMKALLDSWLPAEEYRMRLSMMLLGSGTMDDVSLVAGRCDSEQLMWLNHDTPFFGIDLSDKTFCCYGISDDHVFAKCAMQLQAYAAAETKLVSRACGTLASQGKFERSATVCALSPGEQDLIAVSVAWGVAYVEIGAIELVGEALQSAAMVSGINKTRFRLTEAAYSCVTMGYREIDTKLECLGSLSYDTSTDVRLLQRVKLLGRCRLLWRDPRRACEESLPVVNDPIGLAGVDHLTVFQAISSGQFDQAYAQITSNISLAEPTNLYEAFLCDEMMLSLALVGGMPDVRERHVFAAADDFFRRTALPQIRAYHKAFTAMSGILMAGELDSGAIEDAVMRAERWGDTYLQAVFLATAAVSDLHARALSRAHVRVSKALKMARNLDADYLAFAAELIRAAVLYNIGETRVFEDCCVANGCPPALTLLASMASNAVRRCAGEVAAIDHVTGVPCPRDAFWVMNMLLCDCGQMSEELRAGMPSNWMDQYHSMRVRYQEEKDKVDVITLRASRLQMAETMRVGVQEEIVSQRTTGQRIRISIFGSFSVFADGEKLPDSTFDRRRSRDLLMLLAIAPLHRMPRYQIVDLMWPGEDYIRGPRKLYEATGEARKRLRLEGGEVNALIADKAQGSVGLNPSLVSCDVDEFVSEAIAVVAEDGDDYATLDHARRMEQLYAGGLDTHTLVLGQRVVDRANELESMYVDGIVAAGEAALRLGRGKLAVRYAQEAHRLVELREDAMILLVHALRATGRTFEIPGIYRRFAHALIESQGVPPSAALRHAVDMATSGGYESIST